MARPFVYRPDIDGLRMLAIVPVLLFHLDVAVFSGGFVGVDVFFVISGFLITTLILRELDAGSFSLGDFYRRRILRLLPPLLAMVAAVLGTAFLLLFPDEIETVSRTALAAVLFFSNIHFWQEAGYFTPIAKDNPLLHTWSLAVEEQFYFFAPFGLLLLHRAGRLVLGAAISGLTALSLGLSAVMVDTHAWAAFFLLPTRLWELGLGALIAIWGLSATFNRDGSTIASAAGAGLLAWAVFAYDRDTVFPGLAALVPCAGAALILIGGPASLINRGLATAIPVYLGRISYALYLWHWPLIVFYKKITGPALIPAEMAGLAAGAILLAALSHHLIETPMRRLHAGTSTVLVGTAALLAGIAGVVQIAPDALRPIERYPEKIQRLLAYQHYDESPVFQGHFRPNQCFLENIEGAFARFDAVLCLKTEPGRETVLLFGDSHAAHLWSGLTTARPDAVILQATATGCRPVRPVRIASDCEKLMDYILSDWLPAHRVDRVILSGRWFVRDIPALLDTLNEIEAAGVPKIHVLGPTPEYAEDVPRLLSRALLSGIDRGDAFIDRKRDIIETEMHAAIARTGHQYISMTGIFCAQTPCLRMVGEVPAIFDYGHYTIEGAAYTAQRIVETLSP